MRDIETIAAEWALRVDAGRLEPAARADLDSWLASDPRHRGAFLRAQAGLCLIDEARDLDHAREPSGVETVLQASPPRRPWRVAAALATAACAAGLAMFMAPTPPKGVHQTAVGELRQVAMEDGSLAVINTDSIVRVALAEDRRTIDLKQGEAWFEVAKDRRRPFVVDVGQVHVRATGTAFSVRKLPQAIQVVVTEGEVLAWNDDRPEQRVAISAGNEASLSLLSSRMPIVQPAKEQALAWRDGHIVLDGLTIAEAAEEFNRYNQRKIVIRTAELGRSKMVGYFKINQPGLFAGAAARVTGAKVSYSDNDIVMYM
ncbi:iron dicitrate transport regulator FecR [Sphingomonas oleivorans]|uniref:Iron dicitrate transport regulator FecR n=1 Tax=Sphingomonas oleivorans TaxID=1735121 RepID=A0A2T5FZW1_9SPHN|nr:FecR domain-containing protein [Sphingomonas oleivorans]PTQ12197.1 iron dicitrate transport regulator FecR [Sphingomonas oleivorans]